MKKTVNINLAGTFFHIDEDAFGKLSRYLDAIKKSIADPQGRDEIMRDIEARISELFSEKVESKSQVISIKELDEVISVMGQPEDYRVDEEMFEDAPESTSTSYRNTKHKQLFRDVDHKFISGVSSGLGHYLGVDAIWIRLLWILLTIVTSGTFAIAYILFWILVPAALTTSDKLKMTGEPINISNIEKKFKEGYSAVADKVKNADYDKFGQKVEKGTTSFINTLGSILLAVLKIFVKFVGVMLVLFSISSLAFSVIFIFTFGSVDFWGAGEVFDIFNLVNATGMPFWFIGLLSLFAVGIPLFVLFILGLKLLINNLKSIGTPAKIILLVAWLVSIIWLSVLGIKQASEVAYDGEAVSEQMLPIQQGDTLRLSMVSNNQYSYDVNRHGGPKVRLDENNNKVIYLNDIRLIVRSTNEPVGKLIIKKMAEGNSFLNAKTNAEAISYNYIFENNELKLDGYLLADPENKYRDQEVEVVVYLPIGTILYADENTYSFHRNDWSYSDILDNGNEEKYLLILDGKAECTTCPITDETDDNTETRDNSNTNWEREVRREHGEIDDTEYNVIDENGNDYPASNEINETQNDTINQN